LGRRRSQWHAKRIWRHARRSGWRGSGRWRRGRFGFGRSRGNQWGFWLRVQHVARRRRGRRRIFAVAWPPGRCSGPASATHVACRSARTGPLEGSLVERPVVRGRERAGVAGVETEGVLEVVRHQVEVPPVEGGAAVAAAVRRDVEEALRLPRGGVGEAALRVEAQERVAVRRYEVDVAPVEGGPLVVPGGRALDGRGVKGAPRGGVREGALRVVADDDRRRVEDGRGGGEVDVAAVEHAAGEAVRGGVEGGDLEGGPGSGSGEARLRVVAGGARV